MKKSLTHQKEPWVEWLRIAIPNTEFHSSACNDVWYEQPRKLEEKRECFCGGELRYRKYIKDVENLFSRKRKEFEEAIAHAKEEAEDKGWKKGWVEGILVGMNYFDKTGVSGTKVPRTNMTIKEKYDSLKEDA